MKEDFFNECEIISVPQIGGTEVFPFILRASLDLMTLGLCDTRTLAFDTSPAIYMRRRDKIIGVISYVVYNQYPPPKVFVTVAYVDADHRGNGILLKLCECLYTICKNNGIKRIEFGVGVNNKIMHKIMGKFGCIPNDVTYRREIT